MVEPAIYSVKEIGNWILDYADSQGSSLSNMSLNKLIYFAYEYALQAHGRKLTGAKIEAWDHGPVFREIYSSFKQYGSHPITGRAERYNPRTNCVETVSPAIAHSDEQIILKAISGLIDVPAFILREMSHDQRGAWSAVWHHEARFNPGMEITDEIIISCGSTLGLKQ